MKEKSIILIIGGVLIFGGVWLFRSDVMSLLNGSGGSASGQRSTASAPSVAEHQSLAAKPKKSYHPASLDRPTSSAADRTADAPAIAVVKAPVKNRVKPESSEISPNMSLSEVVDRFGDPDIMASWSNQGTLNRKLVYKNGAEWLEINTRNDRVVSTD